MHSFSIWAFFRTSIWHHNPAVTALYLSQSSGLPGVQLRKHSACCLSINVRVRVNLNVRRVGHDRVRVSNQDVVETGYTPSS